MNEFGNELKRIRKERKVTQRDLAERVKVDFSYISKMENGRLKHTPSIKIINKIAQELNADAEELILLAEKVPETIKQTIVNDDLAAEFLRKFPSMTDEQRKKLEDIIDGV